MLLYTCIYWRTKDIDVKLFKVITKNSNSRTWIQCWICKGVIYLRNSVGWLYWGFTCFRGISAISRLGSWRQPISEIQVARLGIEPRTSCYASLELNHSATAAPHEIRTSGKRQWYCPNAYQVGSVYKVKEKYRGMFEIQKSGDKTSSGEIGLDIRTHASPKVGQDQVSGGVSVLCWHAAPVAYVM